LASSDEDIIKYVSKDIAIWNINSFAEFYLQIFEKYDREYKESLSVLRSIRRELIERLSMINHLRVLPSQANYVMCEILGAMTSNELAEKLLNEFGLLVKDLSSKDGINGQYIRVAIKKPEENERLITAIGQLLN